MVAADVTGCAKTPKWHFGRTKKGFSDPSPPKKTRHIETVEVVFPGSPAGEEFSHSLLRRRLLGALNFLQRKRCIAKLRQPDIHFVHHRQVEPAHLAFGLAGVIDDAAAFDSSARATQQ